MIVELKNYEKLNFLTFQKVKSVSRYFWIILTGMVMYVNLIIVHIVCAKLGTVTVREAFNLYQAHPKTILTVDNIVRSSCSSWDWCHFCFANVAFISSIRIVCINFYLKFFLLLARIFLGVILYECFYFITNSQFGNFVCVWIGKNEIGTNFIYIKKCNKKVCR